MPAIRERLKIRAMGGARPGNAVAYTDFDTSGRLTMTGCARTQQFTLLRPFDFNVQLAACNTGSLYAASIFKDLTGSILAGVAASMAKVFTLNMGAGASPASALTAFAYVEKPRGADTSGSIIALVDWTYGDGPATAGSKTTFVVGLGYVSGEAVAPSAYRTAASTGQAASYNGTACGLVTTACLGKLPSWGASDTGAVVVLQVTGGSSAGLTSGCVHVLGLRLQHLVGSLGPTATE